MIHVVGSLVEWLLVEWLLVEWLIGGAGLTAIDYPQIRTILIQMFRFSSF